MGRICGPSSQSRDPEIVEPGEAHWGNQRRAESTVACRVMGQCQPYITVKDGTSGSNTVAPVAGSFHAMHGPLGAIII